MSEPKINHCVDCKHFINTSKLPLTSGVCGKVPFFCSDAYSQWLVSGGPIPPPGEMFRGCFFERQTYDSKCGPEGKTLSQKNNASAILRN